MDVNGTGTVVVGVDGSPGSRVALEYALGDAARRNAQLRVIAAAQLPDYWPSPGMGTPPPSEDIVADAQAEAQRMVDGVAAAWPDLAAQVKRVVEAVEGSPGEILVAASHNADLLVVGHRGRGAVASALLGSVGLRCVLQAACPVTVVRPVPTPPTASETTSGVAPSSA